MAELKTISNKILAKAGLYIQDENNIRKVYERILHSFVILDIAYGLIQDVKGLTQTQKQLRNRIITLWKEMYHIFYEGMTEDEVAHIDDYVERMADEMRPLLDEQQQKVAEELNCDKDANVCKVVMSEFVTLISAATMEIDVVSKQRKSFGLDYRGVIKKVKRKQTDIDRIYNLLTIICNKTNQLSCMIRKAKDGKDVSAVDFSQSEDFSELTERIILHYMNVKSDGIA